MRFVAVKDVILIKALIEFYFNLNSIQRCLSGAFCPFKPVASQESRSQINSVNEDYFISNDLISEESYDSDYSDNDDSDCERKIQTKSKRVKFLDMTKPIKPILKRKNSE